ncbi:hypothetical protein PoB_001737800 [Plakobranchus ocellatus]|uniref:SH2 domain-containing protein n=1 Tax=Plakobranchus ocellatus TaxID=259542 RepID=A0AAV3Z814_9GAST|nr:hypothetical protein PoB_001737800 [Plakobranchus ocellatus]
MSLNLSSFSPEELSTGACVLSQDVVNRLASVLLPHRSTLARELGLPLIRPVDQELWTWCRDRGSTVYVLASVLERVGRQDCLPWIRLDMEQHMMHLHVAIENSSLPISGGISTGPSQFQRVCTNCNFQLSQALENVLVGGPVHYRIMGPEPWVTWTTQAYELRGRQLTLRYDHEALEGCSLEVDSTLVKQVDHSEESTELKELFLHKDRTLESGGTFVKELHESRASNGSSLTKVKQLHNSGELPDLDSSTFTKQVHVEEETKLKQVVESETFLKQAEKLETCVKSVYVENEPLISQRDSTNLVCSHSNNVNSSMHGEVELGLSDSVIVHAPDTFDTFHQDTLNERCLTHCSTATSKLPISRENMHREASDTKTLPDKDMTEHHLHELDCGATSKSEFHESNYKHRLSQASSKSASQGLSNVPNLSLLDPTFCQQQHDEQRSMELSLESNFSLAERKQNNLNCISVSTAHSLFVRNPLDSPCPNAKSLAEKMYLESRDVSPEIDNSISNNQMLQDYATLEPSNVRQLMHTGTIKKTNVKAQNRTLDGHGEVGMDTSLGLGHAEEPGSTPLSNPAAFTVISAPPLKRQKSNADDLHTDENPDVQLFDMASETNNPSSCNLSDVETQSELDSEMVQHQQLISQNLGQVLHPPESNLYRHTPPPQFLVKIPQYQPPPYGSVPQGSTQQQVYNLSNTRSNSGQSQSSNSSVSSNNSGSGRISVSKVQGPATYHSAQTSSVQSGVPSSHHYMTMAGPDLAAGNVPATKNISSPCTNTVSLPPSQNAMLHLAHGDIVVSSNTPHTRALPRAHQSMGIHNMFRGTVSREYLDTHPSEQCQSAASSRMDPPFHPAPHIQPFVRHNSQGIPNSSTGQGHHSGRSRSSSAGVNEMEHYNYINPDHVSSADGQAGSRRSSLPNKLRVNLEDELRELPGWCPSVNGDNILESMKDFIDQDGAFIIWRSRRHRKFIMTISHQRQLIYLYVQELPPRTRDGGPIYCLFENDLCTESILHLYRHYRQVGLQVPITSPQGGQHMEHIRLRTPLRVRLERRRRR